MKTLRDVTSILSPLPQPPVPLSGDERGPLLIEKAENPQYVWPSIKGWSCPTGSRVLLIEAAGAVGKSSAAQAMAAILNWPRVDASRAQVGSYSLTGLLTDSLGFESPYIQNISLGTAGLIIDALDEAKLKAGSANFIAFVENIRALCGMHGDQGISIILLSRPDTAVDIKLHFELHDTPLAECSIDFFSYQQSVQFINSYMARMHELHPARNYDVAARNPVPFAELRDSKLREICTALLGKRPQWLNGVWQHVNSFLGYAPVLGVLSEFLAVPNPIAAKHSSVFGKDSKSILLSVIQDILVREQDKFKVQVADKLRALTPADVDLKAIEDLYSPDEQQIRLAARLLDVSIVTDLPAGLPESTRSFYKEQANQFMADHPFMAGNSAVNVVFGDYIKAKAAMDPACLAALSPNPQRHVLGPGPFFYQFVREFAPTSEEETDPDLPEFMIPMMIESQSKSWPASGIVWRYVQQEGDAFLFINNTLSGGTEQFVFRVTGVSGALYLPDRVSRAVLITDETVILGRRGGRFTLGPGIVLSAAALEIDCAQIFVDPFGKNSAPSAILVIDEFTVNEHMSLEVPVPGSLAVISEKPWPTFRPYVRDTPVPQVIEYGEYVDLRSVLRCFRQQAGTHPSVFKDLLEQRVIKQNHRRGHYLARLLELGIVYRAENHYYLNTDELSKFGVDVRILASGGPNQSVHALLDALGHNET